jgi:ABC-type cobalamin/Fe3+-siderophores transport system ATPase subunit
MTNSLLQLTDGVIARDNQTLISQVNITLESGEIALLIGPNGSGKSTLLTALAGEKFLSDGTLLFGAMLREHISLQEMARKRSLMLQQDEAVDQLRAKDVLELSNIGADKPEYIQEFVSKIFSATLREKTIGTLSIGQRTRVFLAAAAIQNAGIMLLDEPTAGLDAEGISAVAEFLTIHSLNGHAVMVATHEDNLHRIAKKEFVISEGTLITKLLN